MFCPQCGKQIEGPRGYCGADYVVSSAGLEPHALLDAHIEIGVSRFAFGPEELEDWTEEQLSQNLSSDSQPLFLKLRPFYLEDLTIRHIGVHRRKAATWILNRDSVQLLVGCMPLWPDDQANSKLKWHFFQRLHPQSYLSQNRDFVLLHATQEQVSILEGRGMQCEPRPSFFVVNGITYSNCREVSVEVLPSGIRSTWDDRDVGSYFNHPPPFQSPAFTQIRKWWKRSHDAIITKQIKSRQWDWRPNFDELVENTPREIIEAFKEEKNDPHVWYNVLNAFAEWRALELALDKTITRWPVWQRCAACERIFHESSTRVERLGIEQIDICKPCLQPLFSTSHASSKEEILAYLRKLSELIERVPVNDFGRGADALIGLTTSQRVGVLKLLNNHPSLTSVKQQFGSWFAALVAAGVLPDGSRQGTYGTECLAKDGHRCLSLAEKTIDDFLTAQGVAHEKEVPYPCAAFRADFSVRGTLIEFFGLQGREDYAQKTRKKIELCRSAAIRLIEIYPEDLVDTSRLQKKLSGILPKR